MAERAAARSWWEDVDRRTTPQAERSHPRRRASDHAPARSRRRSGVAEPAPSSERPRLSLVVSEPVDLSTPVARLSEASRAATRDPVTGRRTVTITGQRAAPPRRRPDPATRVGPRPDRIAMWAFLMGIFLVGVATATADAAPL